jgi:hypothetical protein
MTKAKMFMAGCLLLTFCYLTWLYYSEEGFNAQFLANITGTPTGDQPATHYAIEINLTSVTETNNLTVIELRITSASDSPEQPTLTHRRAATSATVIRKIPKVYFKQTRPAALPELETEPIPGERHIIFLETRCVLHDSTTGNQSGLAINPRQACAVASAANTNPDTKIYLLYTCSITGKLGDSPEYVKQMLSYPNVRIWKLVVSDYIRGTPLEKWDFMGKVRSSLWPIVHASDILRYLTLSKYGGTYLDLDFVIRK